MLAQRIIFPKSSSIEFSPKVGRQLSPLAEITDVEAKCLQKMLDLAVEHKAMSPKMQIFCGISPDIVQCKGGLQLIFKSTDGSPACVKPKTAEKLIQRGWASS